MNSSKFWGLPSPLPAWPSPFSPAFTSRAVLSSTPSPQQSLTESPLASPRAAQAATWPFFACPLPLVAWPVAAGGRPGRGPGDRGHAVESGTFPLGAFAGTPCRGRRPADQGAVDLLVHRGRGRVPGRAGQHGAHRFLPPRPLAVIPAQGR